MSFTEQEKADLLAQIARERGAAGGRKRAATLTPERRAEIARSGGLARAAKAEEKASGMARVYVADDKGWCEGCPSYEDVFFGQLPPGAQYVHPANGGHPVAGHVILPDLAAASDYCRELRRSGDWVTPAGEEERPVYGYGCLKEKASKQ